MLRRWIDEGATWGEHWAFVPPRPPAAAGGPGPGLAEEPDRRFVLARLEAEGLTPSPEADRATLDPPASAST